MKDSKQLSPDAAPSTGSGATNTSSTSSSGNIPTKDADFLHTMEAVAAKWGTNSWLTLQWVTQSQFVSMTVDYRNAFTQKNSSTSSRTTITSTLKTLDKQIDDAVTEVKVYIEKKFKKANAIAQFSRYGIVKEGKNYRLSKDRDNRLEALPLMQAAITKDGFDAEEYGKTFWESITANYKTALDAANKTDSTASVKVASKNVLKKQLTKVSVALLSVIKGNFPDTYTSVNREWGWKK